ncbi:protein-L-isoaspartate O-methyltransferase family protein [Chiayiivirga flava]|uniref:Protein-L-isoaspartate O-methyltransferase n=1 Tax=Chiayiivirga flava TaxID=659595 RepID=A0A7W8D748_9GAMM|nr:protein-L-isoaspartate O-methyltransferase [Chiayiivirga flava]MBB5207931.1 protein-L-isoaspartate(D-aspartate) O-methyltransferase [Chiayiivirga flava]
MPIDFELARHAMVEQQVRPWEVLDPRVLDTLATLRREDFVPSRHRRLAFTDMALPLEHGESMMKPVVEGRLLQALDISPEDEVLEIGTGSGFLTACLARLARDVHSIDIHADFVERARDRLAATGLANVRVEVADALGFAPGRQFDAVAVTGAVTAVPAAFLAWLKPGGRLFAVRGHAPALEAVLLRHNGGVAMAPESLFETDLPYLRGAAPVERFVL